MDDTEDRGLDGSGTRFGFRAPATRLGGVAQARWDDPEAASQEPEIGDARRGRGFQKKIADAVAQEQAQHPDKPVEAFATDEHRIGLKPILRRVWAPRGQRPVAPGHHRYEWLYVTAFVSPATGETHWYVTDGVSKPLFQEILETFAQEAGAGRDRTIILVLDNAGWHTKPGLTIPEGIRLLHLPPYSPELQPAECLWELVDEPAVNKHFDTIDDLQAVIEARCVYLANELPVTKGATGFHWWPNKTVPT